MKKVTENYEVGPPFDPKATPVEVGEFSVIPARVLCDEPYVLRVTYTVGRPGIARGGGLQILFQGAQSDDPTGKNFITATSSNSQARFKFLHKSPPRVYITTPDTIRANVNWHAAILSGTDLRAGDTIEISIGTAAQPVVGPTKRRKFADCRVRLQHYLDADGSGRYVPLANSPFLEVLPREGTRVRVFQPSVVRPGETPHVRVAVTDQYGNYVPSPPDIRVDARPNPVKVRATGPQLYWGDIHFHSNLSNDVMMQGIENTPEDCYRYAREVSGLDFACLTDHYEPVLRTWLPMRQLGIGLDEALWEQSKAVSDRLNEPGRFVTWFGYEYRTQRGDTCLYFRDREAAPLLPGHVDSLRRVREYLAGVEFFSAPHLHPYSHQYLTLGPWKWGKEVIDHWQDIGGETEPIIEVFSRHGRYEFYGNQPHLSARRGMTEGNSVQAHLLRGHRFGICAGSDDHWGRPGQDGLIAVYAPELTRAALFAAIKQRRCYGTTNARIIVDFRVNDRFMGESCHSDERTRIWGEVHGTDKLAKVEIIRDGRIIYSVEPTGEDCVVEYEDKMAVLGTCFYYLRVLQRDEQMAWSSPVWVTSTRRIEDMHGDLE